MAIELSTKTNVDAPDSTWIFGKTKDRTSASANDGTPLNQAVMSDYFQFFAKMFAESGLTFNGLLDNSANGFQYYEALRAITNKYKEINSYSVNTTLTDDDYGKLSVMDVAGDADFTLPPLAGPTVKQKMVLMKLGSGVCKVLPNGSEVITPSEEINLYNGDSVVMVSFGFGWLVEQRKKAVEKPVIIHTTSTVSLIEKHLGCLNIISYIGTGTYTLPLTVPESAGEIIILKKTQAGLITVIPNIADVIVPADAILLGDGDSITLISIIGGWDVVSRFDASKEWHYIGSAGEPTFSGNWSNTPALSTENGLRFRNIMSQELEITGQFQCSSAGNPSSIFTLPVGSRPLMDVYENVYDFLLGGMHQIHINASTGLVRFIAGVVAGNPVQPIFKAHFRFPLT